MKKKKTILKKSEVVQGEKTRNIYNKNVNLMTNETKRKMQKQRELRLLKIIEIQDWVRANNLYADFLT